ncbi:MAG: response regulator, partial [Calditrichales bacterium]
LAVMDDSGRLIQVINKSSGLLGNSVWNLFTDNQNGLWVALNNGISRVDLPAPLTYYGENNGIDGTVESIVRHKGILYIATPSGLYYIAANAPVRRISDFRPYKLFAEPRFLLASGYNSGTYTMEKGDMVRISDYSGYIFCQSRLDSNRVFIGLDDGIAAIYLKEGTWRDEGKIALETGPIRDMVENDAGDLWLGTSGGIIYRLRFPHPGTFSTVVQIETFEEGRGLSSSSQNHILRYQGQALIANNNGLLQYVDATDSFTPAGPFADSAANPERSVLDMATDQFQTIWLFSKTPAGLSLEQGTIFAGKYHWDSSPFRPLSDFYYYAIYPDPLHDGVVWLGGAEGLIRYDSGIKKGYKSEFSCMIRRVYTLDDSSIYSGNPLLDASPALHYDLNSLRFEYAAPFFENEPATRYQIMLDGFDPNWSAWSAETKATYTNIPAGKYQFRVRARNIYGKISKTADFPFTIHPPWFQSWWSYALYFLVLCMVFFGLVRLRSLKLEKEKKVLEKIVDERTDEIIVQNRRLEEQAEKLKEMDATKSRFFANISHEFRTPLTLIIGPVEEMLSNSFKGSTEKSFRTILLNAKRLLRLINQLLDLSKLDSGQMKLSAAAGDLSSFLKGILFSFSSYAEIKQIHLQYIEQQPSGLIYFDNDKIEKIAYNLISNALKFTPAGGYITLTVKDYTGTAQNYPEGAVEIIIYDSGIGIDKAYLSNVFERFVQGNPVRISGKGGSGIGLALTRELVEQHHGEIHISSEPNEGTAVSIILPKGKNHLTPDQIVVLPNSDHIKIHTVDLVLAGIDESIRTSDLSSASLIKDDPALIMVIEDHPDVRSYICEHLTETYQVEEAVDGESGLEKSIKMIPDLIISDIMMPGMDGYELTAKLKSNPVTSHIPIILLTARASDKDRIQGLELGADDYLIKPFNVRELLVRIKNLISVRRDLREFFKKELSFQPNQTDHFTMDNKFIGDVCRIIESHISDPALNTDFVQKRMSMSQRQFYRKIHALTGQSPGQLIRSMRLKQARQILGKGGSNISQIAFEVGFTNLSYFSKCFRDQYGKLPSEI